MSQVLDYSTFIANKSQMGGKSGFAPIWMPDFLFDFQKSLVEWALLKGRAAIFADCGLGKTPMQLVWAENVARKTDGRVLILTPLAVANQTQREAEKFGIDARRSVAGELPSRIVITNYDRLHHFSPSDFVGVVCDESSILKSFNGQTRKLITRFMSKMPYRLLCTATAAPNDYVELGTSSEALGELSYSDMLRRFFKMLDDKGQKQEQKLQDQAEQIIASDQSYYQKLAYRVAQTIGQWRLKHHAVTPFWKWVASWARACRMPSDLGFNDGGFVLPSLVERDHMITPRTPPDGMLFNCPAFGLGAERDERRRTIDDRCDFVRDLVRHDRPAVVWCHMNAEGDLLEERIPGSVQIKGSDSGDWKETAIQWFCGDICRCQLNETRRRGKLATCQPQKGDRDIGRNGTANTEKNVSRNPLSGLSDIGRNGESISLLTTEPTETNTNSQKSASARKIKPGAGDTAPTQSIGNGTNLRLKNGKPLTQDNGLAKGCASTGLRSRITNECLPSSVGVVLSAGANHAAERPVITGCTLTTATSQSASGGFSATTAITDSANSEMIPPCSSERCPICGKCRESHRVLITKPKIASFGLNLQHCNHVVTFASHSYEQYYQSVRRCYRFGQKRPVTLDVVATEGEVRVMANMRRKAERAEQMFTALVREMNAVAGVDRVNEYTNTLELPSWL